MPSAMTYTSLLEDIKVYADRDDDPFLAQRERFVMMAENRLATDIRGLGAMQIVQASLPSGNPILAKPSRWRETVSFMVTLPDGTRKTLMPREYQYLREFWPDASLTGEPRFYSDYDFEHFFLAATPDNDYTFELVYYERPEPLSAQQQTNWYTQYAPQVLLYGALLEAQPFLKLDGRTQQFQALYDRAVQGLGNESMRRMSDITQTRREG
jgi:hypothetical protein